MPTLASILEATFESLYPRIAADPQDLARRLARRRQKTFLRIPRTTCLTLRADDLRLADSFPILRPYTDGTPRDVPDVHSLTITHPLLARLSQPLIFPGPLSIDHAADFLGVTPRAIRKATSTHPTPRHQFRTLDARGELGIVPWNKRAVQHARAMGWTDLDSEQAKVYARGRRRVMVIPHPDPKRPFDPSTRRLAHLSDPAYHMLRSDNLAKVPTDFCQQVTRARIFQKSRWPRRPLTRADTDPSNPLSRLPDPDFDDRPDQRNGWAFLCPHCSRSCRLLFLPARIFTLPEYLCVRPERTEADDLLAPNSTLACYTCHNVDFSRVACTPSTWNSFVAQLTGALLYGHEVPIPPSIQSLQEKVRRRKLPTPRPSPKRDEVIQRRLAGEPFESIAQSMNIKPASAKSIWYTYKPPNTNTPTPTPTP